MSTGSGKSPSELSDEDLILYVKDRDDAAVEELYRRHVPPALSFAKSLVGNDFDADDITSEAFFKVVRAIQRGGGPEGPFRPYLLRAVKTSTADHWTAQSRQDLLETPVETSQEDQGFDRVLNEQDRELAGAAFASLPARWQTVLWHVDVEGEPPRRVGPLLGLAPNAVSAVAARARKGLRQAYLEAYVGSSLEESCKPYLPLLAKSALEGLTPGEDLRLQKHFDECAACASAVAALADVRSTMRRAVGPWFLGLIPAPLVLTPGALPTAVSPSGGPSKSASSSQVAGHSAGMGVGAWAAAIAIVACVATAAVAVATGLGQSNQATLDTSYSSAQAGPMAQNPSGGITAPSAPGETPNSASAEPPRSAGQESKQATQAPRPVSTQSPPLSSTAPDVLPPILFAVGSFDLPPVGPPSASARVSVSPSQPSVTPTPTLLVPTGSPTNTVLPTATPSPTPTTALPTATATATPTPTPTPPTATPTPTPVVTLTPEPTCSWWWWLCLQ